MDRSSKIELTNMCLIYDGNRVLVQPCTPSSLFFNSFRNSFVPILLPSSCHSSSKAKRTSNCRTDHPGLKVRHVLSSKSSK